MISLTPASVNAGDSTFRVSPAPAWIDPIDADFECPAPEGATRNGVHELLSDQQVRVSAAGVVRYFHVARRVVTPSGVELASQLGFEFDPPHERLVLHHVRVVRNGRAQDAIRPREIHVIQQESDLSQRIYNGTLTAVAFLHDVRVGDVIDYAYSVDGQNPVLGARFSDSFALGSVSPVHRVHVRLLAPPDRPLRVLPRADAPKPEEASDTRGHAYVWDLRDVSPVRLEDRLPRWFNPMPRFEATEYGTFGEVAAWALPLFEAPARTTKAFAAQVESLRRAAPDDAGRLVSALRFVQKDVRYLGIELGPHSHEPQAPTTVLERRFGDCKDKARLLVALLRALGIEAHVALVNPDLGRGLEDRAPSPLAFNHAIVRARLGDRAYWLDPTLSIQTGDLEALPIPDYERALVIAPDTTALSAMPPHELGAPSVEEVEDLDAHDESAPALLRVSTTYRGGAADAMRANVAESDRAELSRSYLNYYAHDEPSIEEAAAPVITDDPAHAILTVVESYRIPHFWDEETKQLRARNIEGALPSPGVALRTMPLAVKHPTWLVHRKRLLLPGTQMLDNAATDLRDESMSLQCRTSAVEHQASIDCTFKTQRDFVPVAATAEHLRLLGKMREALASSITRPQHQPSAKQASPGLWPIGGAVLGAVALIIAVPYVRRLPRAVRKRAFLRRQALASGEAPATAIPVGSLDEVVRRALRSKCGCGARPAAASDVAIGQLRLGTRAITSARIPCAACGTARSVYFEVRA